MKNTLVLGIVMNFATPVALASYWATIPFALFSLSLIPRILNEEKLLKEELPGYKEYCQKLRFRLIPFVW